MPIIINILTDWLTYLLTYNDQCIFIPWQYIISRDLYQSSIEMFGIGNDMSLKRTSWDVLFASWVKKADRHDFRPKATLRYTVWYVDSPLWECMTLIRVVINNSLTTNSELGCSFRHSCSTTCAVDSIWLCDRRKLLTTMKPNFVHNWTCYGPVRCFGEQPRFQCSYNRGTGIPSLW